MLGENVLGAVIEFAKELKEQETKGLPEWDAGGSVFFDFFGIKMVRVPHPLCSLQRRRFACDTSCT